MPQTPNYVMQTVQFSALHDYKCTEFSSLLLCKPLKEEMNYDRNKTIPINQTFLSYEDVVSGATSP